MAATKQQDAMYEAQDAYRAQVAQYAEWGLHALTHARLVQPKGSLVCGTCDNRVARDHTGLLWKCRLAKGSNEVLTECTADMAACVRHNPEGSS